MSTINSGSIHGRFLTAPNISKIFLKENGGRTNFFTPVNMRQEGPEISISIGIIPIF
jgi:hypothetical protein